MRRYAVCLLLLAACDASDPTGPEPPGGPAPPAPPPPAAPRGVASVSVEEAGTAVVRWIPVDHPDLAGYRVFGTYGSGPRELLLETSDPRADRWPDSSFVGGTVRYVVEATYPATRIETAAAPHTVPPPQVREAEFWGRLGFRIAWSPARYPDAFAEYVLEGEGIPGRFHEIARRSAVADTLLQSPYPGHGPNPPFGAVGYTYRVRTVSRTGRTVEAASGPWRLGEPFLPFSRFAHVGGDAYLVSGGDLVRVRPPDRDVLARRSGVGDVWGRVAGGPVMGTDPEGRTVQAFDAQTLVPTWSLPLADVTGRPGGHLVREGEGPVLSAWGLLVLPVFYPPSEVVHYLLDVHTREALPMPEGHQSCEASPALPYVLCFRMEGGPSSALFRYAGGRLGPPEQEWTLEAWHGWDHRARFLGDGALIVYHDARTSRPTVVATEGLREVGRLRAPGMGNGQAYYGSASFFLIHDANNSSCSIWDIPHGGSISELPDIRLSCTGGTYGAAGELLFVTSDDPLWGGSFMLDLTAPSLRDRNPWE